ncbi:hypothetical protein KTN05_03360 [Paracoccus sp. Z118]|uniref:hypothetical protein n=1 Tax=Paracoccus sp. Z118 TaxID=2851017 RepID=UPI001C2C4A5A|nr:hypothetical protein [Paracoccus sp. Z118]MBV0890885.1 hypothetical protein [Paracoccus sp. Z118]
MPDGQPSDFRFDTGLTQGWLRDFSASGFPLVETIDGSAMEARSLVPLGPADRGREVVLWCPAGGALNAVVLGLIRPPALTVRADEGAVQIIEARERLELRCGPASLTLFSDGRVEIRGTQILSRAQGAQRIQGASVHLN